MKRTAAAWLAAAALAAGCTSQHPSAIMAAPVTRGHFTVGVDLYADRDYPLTQVNAWGARDISYLAGVLHVTAVSIDWDYIIPSYDSDTVDPAGFVTPSPADISALTRIARAHGMTVAYRVMFWLAGKTAPLSPAHPGVFLANLLNAEKPALQLAQRWHVTEFIAGTERTPLEDNPDWPWFLTRAARIYHGTLTYAMWGGEPGSGGFFFGRGCSMPVAVCGVTAYPDTGLPASAATAELAAAWQAYLARVPASVLHRTEIDEIGIPAVDGAYAQPWNWSLTGRPDGRVQARWFAAACMAAARAGLRGIYFWDAGLSADPAGRVTAPTGFEGHPASVAAIRRCAQTGGQD